MLANLFPDNSRTQPKSHRERRLDKRPTPSLQGAAHNIQRELAQLDGLDDPGHTQGLPVYRKPQNFARLLKLALCSRTCLKSALTYLDAIGRACWRYSRPGNVDVPFMLKAMATVDLECIGRVAHPSTHMRYVRLFVRASILQTIGVRGEYNLTHFVRLNGGPEFWRLRLEAKRSGSRNRDLFDALKRKAKAGRSVAGSCTDATKQDVKVEQKQPVAKNHSHKNQRPLGFSSINKEDQSAHARGDRFSMQAVSKPRPHAVTTQPRRPCEPRPTPVLACQQACVPGQGQPDTSAEADKPPKLSALELKYMALAANVVRNTPDEHKAFKAAQVDAHTARPAATPAYRPPSPQPQPKPPVRTSTEPPASARSVRQQLQAAGVDPFALRHLDRANAWPYLASFKLNDREWVQIGMGCVDRDKGLDPIRNYRSYLTRCARNCLDPTTAVAA